MTSNVTPTPRITPTFIDAQRASETSWDYIIVGAGAAGCVLANRLSADPQAQVLLIEAGGSTLNHPGVESPTGWSGLQGGAFDWGYRTAEQAGLGGRTLPYPRGLGLGGSTAINALGYTRGPPQGYDRWQTAIDAQGRRWDYQSLLPYFKRSESFADGANLYRGGDGPLHVFPVASADSRNPLSTAFHSAAAERYGTTADFNGATTEGAAWAQLTLASGLRDSAATAYLLPAASRPNFSILPNARALRLLLNSPRCPGVEIDVSGKAISLTAGREMLVCAGAVDSPRLLMLSGIGPAPLLESLGIPVQVNCRGVGQNLQDHLLFASVLYESPREIPSSQFNHAESLVATHGEDVGAYADLLMMGLSVPFVLPGNAPPAHAFSIVPACMNPKSRGHVSLMSADPKASPRIDPGYFSEPADLESMLHAIAAARDLGSRPELRDWVKSEVFPGSVASRQQLVEIVRSSVSSFYHPSGTCRMGATTDHDAVVDQELRIIGCEALRVIDASVFPYIPLGMTEAATLAVAERAAALIVAAGSRKAS